MPLFIDFDRTATKGEKIRWRHAAKKANTFDEFKQQNFNREGIWLFRGGAHIAIQRTKDGQRLHLTKDRIAVITDGLGGL